MMAATIDAIKTGSSVSVTNSQSSNIVNKDDFFKMLVAQLKNQDPMKPLDATAFTAQLAQFSSLEKLENINSTLTNLLGQQDSFNRTESAQLVGKYVVANGNQAGSFTAAGKPVELGYDLPADAKQVLITIYDDQGRAVDMIQKSDQSTGVNKVVWQNGSARKGSFTFQVAAFDGKGSNLNATAVVEGIVSKVNFHGGKVYATVNNKEVGIEQILSVSDVKS
jgi:flagellar basal-body rod modification protein FlgD